MGKITSFEKFAYSMGALGQNMAYGLMATYLMIFYTDNIGIAAGVCSILFFAARLWDAVIDPIIGIIIDRVNTKYGKFRPFILIGGVLAGIMTILCFVNPDIGITGKATYAFITYIIWGTTYGIMDVPYWSMASSMTLDPIERTRIVSIPKTTGAVGALLVAVFTIPMVQVLGNGNNSKGYFITALIFGIFTISGAIISALFTKERVKITPRKKEKFADTINVVTKNPPLILILLANLFFNIILTMKQISVSYYFTYFINDMNLIPIFMLAGMIPMILAMMIVPAVSKKIGKKAASIWCAVLCCVSSAILYYTGSNLLMLFILNILAMVGMGGISVLTMSMQADTVEYAEWKTGKRSESIVFSLGTFTTKLSSAIGGALIGICLTLVGYKANAQQSQQALNGINLLISWVPTIGMVLFIIVISFYNLTEKRHEEIVKKIKDRGEMEIPV